MREVLGCGNRDRQEGRDTQCYSSLFFPPPPPPFTLSVSLFLSLFLSLSLPFSILSTIHRLITYHRHTVYIWNLCPVYISIKCIICLLIFMFIIICMCVCVCVYIIHVACFFECNKLLYFI